jgi:hypothetical protein
MSKQVTPPTKAVLEVESELQERAKAGAKREATSIKRFTGLILDYALSKYESGEIILTQPEVIEPAEPARLPDGLPPGCTHREPILDRVR